MKPTSEDALTMQVDALPMQVDALPMQADALPMQADAFTMLTFCLNLPNLKLYLTDRFLVTMGTLNVDTILVDTFMTIQDTNRRLRPQTISQDIDSLHGLQTVSNYNTTRADASTAKLQEVYQAMLISQQTETEKLTLYRAAADGARLAEWEYHNSVLAMKEVVRGQYGSDSDQAQAVGLKKKSDRKRPSRKKLVAMA